MNQKNKMILMRHGKAQHNQAKQYLKAQNPKADIKKLPFYEDSLLIPQGQQQCYDCSKLLEQTRISLVLVSPLRRCLQTSQIIIQSLKSNPKVIVEPLLADRRSSAWSLNWRLQQSKELFRNFDWTYCNTHNEEIQKELKKKQEQRKQNSTVENINSKDETIEMRNIIQNYDSFMKRILKLKEKLKKYSETTQDKILIISHSSLFKFLLADQYLPNGKAKSKFKFQHCNPFFCDPQTIFKSPKL